MMHSVLNKLILFLSVPAIAFGAFGVAPDGHLDKKTLSSAYQESEFEPVRVSVEKYLKQKGDAATREDKIFAFKYLGVIYASDSSSRIRAESYFNRLLDLAPNIELIDMYVSPKIMEIFENIKNERRRNEEYRQKFDAFGNPIKPSIAPSPNSSAKDQDKLPTDAPLTKAKIQKQESNMNWLWWTIGGVAVVGAGVGYYMMNNEQASPGRTIDVGGTK